MRHGWKTRMDERRYFEEKREDREAKAAFAKFARARILHELMQVSEEMKRDLGDKYATH